MIQFLQKKKKKKTGKEKKIFVLFVIISSELSHWTRNTIYGLWPAATHHVMYYTPVFSNLVNVIANQTVKGHLFAQHEKEYLSSEKSKKQQQTNNKKW